MEKRKNTDNVSDYDDMIDLPHHVSTSHPHMEILDRAAQFSPFAALTGHGAAIRETARLTGEKMELDQDRKEILNETLLAVMEKIEERPAEKPAVTLTYFEPDGKKAGGAYRTITGVVKRIDEYGGRLILMDGTEILIEDVAEMFCETGDGEIWKPV